MVRVGRDLLVLGGHSSGWNFSDALFKLSCSNNKCKWENLSQKLETPKDRFVAIPVPDSFVTCN